MDCKPSNDANKKLVQARLPFKRLNPEPKENHPPKRPCAHTPPDPEVSDRENESSPLPLRTGPPLVNGRGPIDGFFNRRRPGDENMVIDLTDEKTSPVKCPPSSDKKKDRRVSTGKLNSSISHSPKKPTADSVDRTVKEADNVVESDDDADTKDQTDSISALDTTQESECEAEESHNISTVTESPNSSMCESSPERSPTSTPIEPKTTPKIPADEKKIKRRSLKSLQEQEERLRVRQEKERQKEEAKAAKEKKKEEARKLKEEKEREKREKKERDERERKEKKEKEEKEKAERLKAKEEQRKNKMEAKLEEKRKKEEEKRVKEEEKRLKEEKDRLKAEKAEITRFLQKAKTQQAPKTLAAGCGKFAPFEIKENMFLAPLCRVSFEDSDVERLDEFLLNPVDVGLKDWISQKPRCSGPTKTRTSLSECLTVEAPKPDGVPDRSHHGPMKLLQFHQNYRPAYWGTWRKRSSHISPRCPLRQDKDLLDYEVDSDEEWEEEEPGESLSHSEGEDEEGGEEDDEDDDGFFVPHGYLSEDEGALEEEDGGDLEKQKLQQKLKAKEWDELMSSKKKMKFLEPVLKGCVWEGQGQIPEVFQSYALCLIEPLSKPDNSPSPEEQSVKSQQQAHLLGQLLPLLHGNINSSKVIITEFQEFCRQQTSSSTSSSSQLSSPQSSTENVPPRIQLKRLIKSNAVYEKRSTFKRCCWYVHKEVLTQYNQETLPVPCHWTYLTPGAREEGKEENQAATGSQGNSPTPPHTSSTGHKRRSTGSMSITKFIKRCSGVEPPEAMEADGFQADTEEDDDEECVIVSTSKQSGLSRGVSTVDDQPMEVSSSASASLPVSSTASTQA